MYHHTSHCEGENNSIPTETRTTQRPCTNLDTQLPWEIGTANCWWEEILWPMDSNNKKIFLKAYNLKNNVFFFPLTPENQTLLYIINCYIWQLKLFFPIWSDLRQTLEMLLKEESILLLETWMKISWPVHEICLQWDPGGHSLNLKCDIMESQSFNTLRWVCTRGEKYVIFPCPVMCVDTGQL